MRFRAPMLSVLSLLCLVCSALAESQGSINWQAYERGDWGPYPQRTFQSSDASVPLVNVPVWSTECETGTYTLLSPRGKRVRGNKVLLLDDHGDLVWHHQERGSINTVQVQKYKDDHYITMWVGDDDYYGHGHGYYKMVRHFWYASLRLLTLIQYDQTYTLAYTIDAGNGVDGDYHDFSITADDTAIITSYVKTPWDLTSFERESGFIWDCRFQEIDIENNQVLFEWRASEHFRFSDMAVNSWTSWTGTNDDPWDWFHLNSVEKDQNDNYLISARYSNAVSYIDGKTSQFLWHLGGRNNSFVDLAEGNVTKFVDPHMARWDEGDSTTITLFDNVAFWTLGRAEKYSYGIKILLDRTKMIAKSLAEFVHPTGRFAQSEGSMQRLENGNYLISYGTASAYSEFSPEGKLLCDAHYAPLSIVPKTQSVDTSTDTNAKDSGNTEAAGEVEKEVTPKQDNVREPKPDPSYVESYRVYKHRWSGHPKEAPDMKIDGNFFHVSWNGATEVKSWELSGRASSGRSANVWKRIGTFQKTGFETSIDMKTTDAASYLLTALDAHNAPIRAWNIHSEGDIWEVFHDADDQGSGSSLFTHMLEITSILCVGYIVYINRRLILKRKSGGG